MSLNTKYSYLQRWLGGVVNVETNAGRPLRLDTGHLERGFLLPWREMMNLISGRSWLPEAWLAVEPDQRRCLQDLLGPTRVSAGAAVAYQRGVLVTPNGLDLIPLEDLARLLDANEKSVSLREGVDLWYAALLELEAGHDSATSHEICKSELNVYLDRPYSSFLSTASPQGSSLHYLISEDDGAPLPLNVGSVSFRLLGIRLKQ